MAIESDAIKILFVDDEELVLKALRRTLRTEGFQLYFTADPHDASRIAGAERIDIVVSDYMMPLMCGIEVLAMMRTLHPRTVRIMLTGQADREAAIRAVNEGSIHRFLEKPWDEAVLKNVLHEAARSIRVQRSVDAANPPVSRLPPRVVKKAPADVVPEGG